MWKKIFKINSCPLNGDIWHQMWKFSFKSNGHAKIGANLSFSKLIDENRLLVHIPLHSPPHRRYRLETLDNRAAIRHIGCQFDKEFACVICLINGTYKYHRRMIFPITKTQIEILSNFYWKKKPNRNNTESRIVFL